MRKNISNSFLLFAELILAAALLSGCGDNCNIVESVLGQPSCKKLRLEGTRTFVGTKASCAGSANSRKVSLSCPPSAGTASQCTQIANGFPIFSILVPNSGGGTFQDDDGTSYATCQAILNAYNSGSLHHVLGVYVSDSTLTGDIVSCTNSGGCTMNSVQCYAGWDASGGSLSGSTASIPLGTNALACTYIDTTSL
ncbi:MAG: hypothetical protein ACXWSD_03550, partial [Bdellovibrionota bacterium]